MDKAQQCVFINGKPAFLHANSYMQNTSVFKMVTIGMAYSLTVGMVMQTNVGMNQSLGVGKDRDVKVGANQTTQVGTKYSLTVGGGAWTPLRNGPRWHGSRCAGKPTIGRIESGLGAPQRGHSPVQALGPQHLEEVERRPPAQPCGDEEALLQATGERMTARTFDRQVGELHIRVTLLNRFGLIGRPQTVPVAAGA